MPPKKLEKNIGVNHIFPPKADQPLAEIFGGKNFLIPINMEIKIVISGSFRKYLNDIGIAIASFEKANIKVLAPLTKEAINSNDHFVFLATDDPKKSADTLEKEFMVNVEKADFLYLANIGGYVGQSAATEMGVALMNGVPIIIAEAIKKFSDEIPETVQELLKKSVFRQLPIREINAEKIAELNFKSFVPADLSSDEWSLLRSLVNKLLNNLKFVKMPT